MAKFIFSMESLLSLKSRMEEQKKQEFGEAMNRLEHEKNVLNSLHSEKEFIMIRLRESVSNRINPIDFQNLTNYVEVVKKKIIAQMGVIIEAEKFVEKKRLDLVAATKERKMLDKIKEKKREEYIEEEKKQEQKINDEIVSYKYSSL